MSDRPRLRPVPRLQNAYGMSVHLLAFRFSQPYHSLYLCQFTSATGLQAKVCDDSVTRKALGTHTYRDNYTQLISYLYFHLLLDWQPVHKNFGAYMLGLSGRPYTLSPLIGGKPRPSARKLLEAQKKQEEKRSALWLPGDDDGLL